MNRKMPVEKESRIAAGIAALREWVPTLRNRLGEWYAQVRAEPVLIWQTDAVRYSVYGIGVLAAVFVLIAVVESVAPKPPPGAGKPAKTAFFDVLCTEPGCGHHFLIERKFKFRKFPVTCPECGKKSGHHAMRVRSGPNKGQWVVRPKE